MSKSTHTILLVEDDDFLRRMYTTKLSTSGFEVIGAADGEKALELAKKFAPDVILLDVLLPKKDGFVVLKELRASVKTKATPVIMLTNLSEVDDVRQARKLGANEYLIKAQSLPSEVIEMIQSYVS